MPYLGYIAADVAIPGLSENSPAVFLVVPDTDYNRKVPVLLGTNILKPVMEKCKEDNGARFLQKMAASTPWWLTFRCLQLQDKALTRTKGRLGLVKSAEMDNIRIPKNGSAVITGSLTDTVMCNRLAMTDSTEKTVLPSGVEVMPTLINHKGGATDCIQVEILNPTDRPVIIPPRGLICELQEVEQVDMTARDEPDGDTETTTEASQQHPETEEEFFNLFNLEDTDLDTDQTQKLRNLLLEYQDIFSRNDLDIGHTSTVKHRIDLVDEVPFKQRHRRIPPSMFQEVKDHLRQLLEGDIIRQSNSPYSSSVVLIRKKATGKLRFCIDLRELNNRTVKDSYALPRLEEILDQLQGSTYFSSLDMRSGYYQVELEEQHKPRTAFTVGPLGFYECNRMPFGLTNAPATFQRLMERCMGELYLKECAVFLDDILIYGAGFDMALDRLKHVFSKLRAHNLKLNPEKCRFFQRRVKFCGHVVTENGVETDPAKIEKVAQWPTPSNAEQVREYLGFTGYYRRYIKDYAKIAKPLTDLLVGTMRHKSKRKSGAKTQPKPEWTWGPPQQAAFDKLKSALTAPPILAYADFTKSFVLHTDSSGEGLGAVLCQEQDGRERVIAYASRSLTKTEKNYPVHKQEFLALKWAITEKFHDYLYGQDFTVLTDNNPLTYVLTTAKLDAAGHRWLAALASYRFTVKYRAGIKNADADALSRLPKTLAQAAPDPGDRIEISLETVGAICNLQTTTPYAEVMCFPAQVLDDFDQLGELRMTTRDWRIAQREDPVIGQFLDHVSRGVKPKVTQIPDNQEARHMLRQFNHLQLRRGVLYRSCQVQGEQRLQLVLPQKYRKTALEGLHDDVGHLGRDKTLNLVRDRYYWPRMAADVDDKVKGCERCVKRKARPDGRAPLTSIQTSQPMELVCMDFLTLETAKGGFQHLLVVTDHYTKYAQAIPTKNMTARTTAEALVSSYFVHYGMPQKILSDQGPNFESSLVKQLLELTGVKKCRTTPYHAMSNGHCERLNRTLLEMLGTLQPDEKSDWKSHIGPLVHAYNATRHETTHFSPFYLMFGRHPRLPVDLVLNVPQEEEEQTQAQYVQDLRQRLQSAYELATAQARKAQQHQKDNYDKKVKGSAVQVGDRVLVEKLAFDGKHKIADRWEHCPYTVLRQDNPDIPVFVLVREDGEGRERTLHRNHLLPITHLPVWDRGQEDDEMDQGEPGEAKDDVESDGTSTDVDSSTGGDEEDLVFVQGEREHGDQPQPPEEASDGGDWPDWDGEADEAESESTDSESQSEAEQVDTGSESNQESDDSRDDVDEPAADNGADRDAGQNGDPEPEQPEAQQEEARPQSASDTASETEEAGQNNNANTPPRRSARTRNRPDFYPGTIIAFQGTSSDRKTEETTEQESEWRPGWQAKLGELQPWERKAFILEDMALRSTAILPNHKTEAIYDRIVDIVASGR